jgi:hypothetical protein
LRHGTLQPAITSTTITSERSEFVFHNVRTIDLAHKTIGSYFNATKNAIFLIDLAKISEPNPLTGELKLSTILSLFSSRLQLCNRHTTSGLCFIVAFLNVDHLKRLLADTTPERTSSQNPNPDLISSDTNTNKALQIATQYLSTIFADFSAPDDLPDINRSRLNYAWPIVLRYILEGFYRLVREFQSIVLVTPLFVSPDDDANMRLTWGTMCEVIDPQPLNMISCFGSSARVS